jgi:hypothetical protein
LSDGRTSQRTTAGLSFDAVGFGHGKPIVRDTTARVRQRRGEPSATENERSPHKVEAA